MRLIAHCVVMVLFFLAGGMAAAQEWELGVYGGYGISPNPTVERTGSEGKAGLKHGLAAGVVAGNDMYERVSGEMHYVYRVSDLKASGGGEKASFSGESHLVHYDLLYHTRDRGERVRPFLAGGGGLRVYRGTGAEHAYQPASNYAVLTRTQETKPLISAGGGVKIAVRDSLQVRIEVRDYITPFPKSVIMPAIGATIKGWLHDFVPTVGIGIKF